MITEKMADLLSMLLSLKISKITDNTQLQRPYTRAGEVDDDGNNHTTSP